MPNQLDSTNIAAPKADNHNDPTVALQADAQPQPHKSYLQSGVDFALDHTIGSTSGVGKFVSQYAGEALTTLALFTPGKTALAASIALGSANQMKVGDSLGMQVTELGTGAAQGFLSKKLFDKVGSTSFAKDALWTVPAKGVFLGASSRAIDIGLTPQTWMNSQGQFQPGQGALDTFTGTFNPTSLALDATIFSVAHGAGAGLNKATGGMLDRSPALRSIAIGTTFGATSGGMQDIVQQRKAGHSVDWGEVAQSSLIHAAINGIASAPGSVMADPAARQAIVDKLPGKDALRNSTMLVGVMGSVLVPNSGADRPVVHEGPDEPPHTITEVTAPHDTTADAAYLSDGTGFSVANSARAYLADAPEGQLRYSVNTKSGGDLLGETDNVKLSDATGAIHGSGKTYLAGTNDLTVSAPENGTLRLVLRGNPSESDIRVADDNKGKIEVVNETMHPVPEGLLRASEGVDSHVAILDPLSDIFTPAEIARIDAVEREQKQLPQSTLVQDAMQSIDPNLPFDQRAELEIRQKAAQAELDRLVDVAYGDGAPVKGKVLHIVIGPPGAGKSSLLVEPLAKQYGAMVVDSDKVKPLINGYNNGLGTNAVHVDSAYVVAKSFERGLEQGDSMIYAHLGRVESALIAHIELGKSYGYDVAVHIAHLDPDLATRRVFDRGELPPDESGIRQMVPPRFALQVVASNPMNSFDTVIGMPNFVDAWSHYDTNVPRGFEPILMRASEGVIPPPPQNIEIPAAKRSRSSLELAS